MEADLPNPIGFDGKSIKVGELVSVYGDPDSTNNGIYSKTEDGWLYQGALSNVGDVIDGGDAFTQFGGANIIDGGNAFGN